MRVWALGQICNFQMLQYIQQLVFNCLGLLPTKQVLCTEGLPETVTENSRQPAAGNYDENSVSKKNKKWAKIGWNTQQKKH